MTASERKLPANPEELVDDKLPYYVTEALPHVDMTKNLIVMDGGIVIQPRGKWETPSYAIPKGKLFLLSRPVYVTGDKPGTAWTNIIYIFL